MQRHLVAVWKTIRKISPYSYKTTQSGTAWLSSVAETETDLTLAPSAVERLKELRTECPDRRLRITVEGGGCSGFQYKFSLDDDTQQDDIVYGQDGVEMVCDKVSLGFLKGSTVEFSESLMKSAFQIKDNPNSEISCSCGASFSTKM